MNIVVIDAKKLAEKSSAHEYLKALFAFPEYYGNNLDALYDCVSERTGTTVIFQGKADGYAARVLSVLEECAHDRAIKLICRQ